MESFCPLHIDLNNQECLVIGGGKVAGRKVNTLLAYRAAVTVLSPDLSQELASLLEAGKINYQADIYRPVYLEHKFLVVCATADEVINRRAAEECISRGIPVNTVSDPEKCTFFLPAQLKKGPLTVTVSTAGKSPALARRLRDRIGESLDPCYEDLARFLGKARKLALKRIKERSNRRALLEYLAGEDFFAEFKKLPGSELDLKLEQLLKDYSYEDDKEKSE